MTTEERAMPADEWKTVSVKGFDDLIAVLERADRKGYMPDAMADEWAAFDYRASPAPAVEPAPQAPQCDSQEISALRWLLNITTEFDRKDVRTRQAARLLDEYRSGDGRTNRELLESVWSKIRAAPVEPAADLVHPAPAQGAADEARDAARYRLLRRGQHWSVIDGIGDILRAEVLDSTIDAAMTAPQGNVEKERT